MSHKIGLILLLFFTFTLGFSSQIHASVGSGDFVVYRANISPMYIANESVVFQAMAIPFHGNKPFMATVKVWVSIKGLNVNYTLKTSFDVMAGRLETLYLPALQEGHYEIMTWAEYNGIKSKVIDEDFGVTEAPVPYTLTISSDGSIIHFQSLRYNSTGQPDPKYPFTLLIYVDSHGTGESLVKTITNVTNITIQVPESWKTGILYVEVVDVYGWHNGNSINLANMQFAGTPLSYDYYYAQREPYKSHTWEAWLAGIVIFLILMWALYKLEGERNGRR